MFDHEPFDVLMPVYIGDNTEVAIMAIQSVLKNTLQPKRFVIVKDGPVSKSLDSYLNDLQKDHANVYICGTNENFGLGAALNFGLQFCTEDFVFRCDADDLNDPMRFELQLSEMLRDPCDVLGTQIIEVDPVSGEERIKHVPTDEKEIIKFSRYRNPMNHMTVLFKKSVIEDLDGYPNIKFKEDFALWLKVLSRGYRVRNLEIISVRARAGDSMLSRRRGIESLKSELELFRFRVFECKQRSIITVLAFILRANAMVLPLHILKRIYTILRFSKVPKI